MSDSQHPSSNPRAGDQHNHLLSNLSSEGLMVHQNGIIADSNLAFANLLGYDTPDDLIGKNVLDIFQLTPEYRKCVLSPFQIGAEQIHELEVANRNGAKIPVEITCKDILYEDQPTRLVSMRDIHIRKHNEIRSTRQLERLNILQRLDRAVSSVMTLDEILQLFVQQIIEQIQVDACSILLLNPQTQTLDFAAKQGFLTRALEFTRLGIGKGLAGRAALNRKTILIPDLHEIKNNPVLTDAIKNENFVMYIGIPLIVKENLLGVLEIFHRSKFTADPDWVQFVEILANEAAIAVDNARLLNIAQQSFKETNALYQINKKLIGTVDTQELMDDVVNLLKENFGYYYVQIFVADPKTGNLVMRAGSGELGTRLKEEGYCLSAGDGIIGVTAETGKPFFTNNVEAVFTFIRPPHLTGTKSELAVPIRNGNQYLGLLDIHQVEPLELTERDVQLVTAVADQLAVALLKAALYTELQEALHQEKATRSLLLHNEKLTVAGRLLASVSHELNNPIQAIQNALFLLRDEQGLSDQGKQDLDLVLCETERMASLLDRLRSTYQPISSSDYKPVDLNKVIQDVGALVATHLRHHKIIFEMQLDPDLPQISGLDDQIRQVMLNLVMNSVEAMNNGGRLRILSEHLVDSQRVHILVTDTGPGITEDILPNIFDAFITNKKQGTGLGLTISNEIILKHGGRMQAENNPECGASIHILLPITRES